MCCVQRWLRLKIVLSLRQTSVDTLPDAFKISKYPGV